MEKFLSTSKAMLVDVTSYSSVCVVLGNEACDLDSAVSALVLAFYLGHKNKFAFPHIPVLNIVKEDFALKTEVVYLFQRINILPDHLVFRDEICLKTLKEEGKLKLVLVDHNVLPNSDVYLNPSIVQIVDHHQQENISKENTDILIEPVGSCCTLVGSIILENATEILNTRASLLLCGAILVDVANFSTAAGRATHKDKHIYNELVKFIPEISQDTLFHEIQQAKEDVSNLQIEQMLRKDAKVLEVSGVNLVLCGFPLLCSTLLTKYSDFFEKLQGFCFHYNYQGVVLLGISINSKVDAVKRDLLVYSQSPWLKNKLCSQLENAEPSLNLVNVRSDSEHSFYEQKNTSLTRKTILPLLKSMFHTSETSNTSLLENNIINTPAISKSPYDGSSASSSNIDVPTPNWVEIEEAQRSSTSKLSNMLISGDDLGSLQSKAHSMTCHHGSLRSEESDPLTPKNSFAESNFDQSYKKFVLNHIDSETVEEKLQQKTIDD